MDDPQPILKVSLLAGGAFALAVSVAHFFGMKIPFLYVYFDVPSNAYQDKLISFTAFGWAMFFVATYSNMKRGSLRSVRYVIISGAVLVGGLVMLNFLSEFGVPEGGHRLLYWLATGVFGVFFGWLALLYVLSKQSTSYSNGTSS